MPTPNTSLLLALLIGFLAGLRSLTPPAVVAWATKLGWLKVNGVLAFMGSVWSAGIFTVLALGELAADKWAKIPNRTDIPPLVARVLTGGLCGACVAASGGGSLEIGAALGAVGGVAGAFSGFHARKRLVQGLGVPDFYIAVIGGQTTISGNQKAWSMLVEHMMARAAIVLVSFLASIPAFAQDYPSKPVRLVTAEVGGGHDLTARLIAQGLTAHLGQQFIVDNRAGAIVAGQLVAKAPADGYTLLIFGTSLWLMPYMRSYVPYDVLRDFAPIGMEVNAPILVVVHPQLPVKSVKELIALARKKPGSLDYATGQTGSSTHLASELFKSMAGINMQRIPYKGNGPAMNGLIAGEVQLMFPTAGAAAAQMKSGRLRALAITSAKPSALFPDLPTVAAAGLPGYECDSPIGAFAPAKTPPAIISLLSKEMATAVNRPEIKQSFAAAGVETIGSSPQAAAAAVKSEMTRLGKLLKDLGVREE